MRRREFITLLGGAVAAWPIVARSQQSAGKLTPIGYLGVASASDGARGAEAFETGLRDLGYVQGKSIVIDYRWASGRYEQLDPTTAAALAAKSSSPTLTRRLR